MRLKIGLFLTAAVLISGIAIALIKRSEYRGRIKTLNEETKAQKALYREHLELSRDLGKQVKKAGKEILRNEERVGAYEAGRQPLDTVKRSLDWITEPSFQHVRQLHEALRERGVELVVVGMPYRADIYRGDSQEIAFDPVSSNLVAAAGLKKIELEGIPTIDLGGAFRRISASDSIWSEDGLHLNGAGINLIADALGDELASRSMLETAEGRHLTFIGECFAVGYEMALRSKWPNLRTKSLRAFGNPGRVTNLLFIYEEEYLADSERVIFVVPYHWLSEEALPPLVTNPQFGVEESVTQRFTIQKSMGVDYFEFGEKAKRLPYPNALSELVAVNQATGEKSILVGYAVTNRVPTGLREIKDGSSILCKTAPLNPYLLKHPEVAKEYYVFEQNDFVTPRRFLLSWTMEEG